MSPGDAAARIAARFDSLFLQSYVRSKLRTDPVYSAVLHRLQRHPHPLVDLGCGVGLLPLLLRADGFEPPIIGIDFDPRKIETARKASNDYAVVEFRAGDARDELPPGHSVVMLDLLHYFTVEEQRTILAHAASVVPPGGMVIIRDAIDDGSWRYRTTWAAEAFARLVFWLKAERLNFPTRETLMAPFSGWEQELIPLWGRTPFNNYLLVFRRPGLSLSRA